MPQELTDSQSNTVVTVKALILTISVLLLCINLNGHVRYKKMHLIFKDFNGGDFCLTLAIFAFMSFFVNLYGMYLFSVESNLMKKKHVRKAVYVFLAWEIALLLKYFLSAFLLYRAYNSTWELFDEGFFEAMRKYGLEEEIAYQIDDLQNDFECCGNFDYKEWLKMDWKRNPSDFLVGFPKSCCDYAEAVARSSQCFSEVHYQEISKLMPTDKGCLHLVRWWYSLYLLLSASVFVLATFFQIVSVILEIVVLSKGVDMAIDDEKVKLLTQQHAIFEAIAKTGLKI